MCRFGCDVCSVTENVTYGYGGGIVSARFSDATLIDTPVSANTVATGGGGISAGVSVTLSGSTAEQNVAGVGGGLFGGAVIQTSASTSNSATANGGWTVFPEFPEFICSGQHH